MRKGNKTRLLIALLTLALTVSGTAFARIDEVETDLGFADVPNAIEEVEPAQEAGLEAADFSVSIMADATMPEPAPQAVEPGKVIEYNGKLYRITGTNNVANLMGGFDDGAGNIASNGEEDVLILDGNHLFSYDSEDGHDKNGCLQLESGTFIWRHKFTDNKLYVYSAWWKVVDPFNFQDDQRQLEGAYDPDTGSSHMNEIGRQRAITNDWQQDLCVFKGKNSERRFLYVPVTSGAVKLDDVYIYEVEAIDPFVIGRSVIEDDETWSPYENIPRAGAKYNCVINYTSNSISPIKFNGVLALFKDGKLYGTIKQKAVSSRMASLIDGVLTPMPGTVSIPFEIPEGEDISRFKCVAFLGDASAAKPNPFFIYGTATNSYAAVFNGAKK